MRRILAMFLMLIENELFSVVNTVTYTPQINHGLISKGVKA